MKQSITSKLFLAAAIFNWVMGLGLFFVPHILLGLFSISPGIEQTLWVQQFAGLVFMFGIGYYWASRDLNANAQIIRLGAIAKCGVVLIGIINVLTGDTSWQFLIPISADAAWAVLFIAALR